jgi:hypothetical protein
MLLAGGFGGSTLTMHTLNVSIEELLIVGGEVTQRTRTWSDTPVNSFVTI